jgi:FKBP-type peptidyl-prolyl cis-trans isomerase
MRTLFFLLCIVFLFSCGEKEKPKKQKYSPAEVKELSVQMNTWDEKRQNDEINQYVKAHGWEMEMTPIGLRYMMIKPGNGKGGFARGGQVAKVNYKIYLLDGTVCYTSEKDGPKDFLIGQDNVEFGLHEGIKLMRPGDKMRFILPSHLAHGLTGDQSEIPPRSSVIYDIELLELSDPK